MTALAVAIDLATFPAARYWSKVERQTEPCAHRPDLGPCWLWTGTINQGGYGRFTLDGHMVVAHRVGFLLAGLTIPDGFDLDHLCRVRSCVFPGHLEPVTPRENVLRGEGFAAEYARRTHCPSGHEYAAANVYLYRGKRYCRACQPRFRRELLERKRAEVRLLGAEAKVPHGRHGTYANYQCRCPVCVEAEGLYREMLNARKVTR